MPCTLPPERVDRISALATEPRTMTATAVRETTESLMVGMAQIVAASQPICLTAVLGSCVGVALYHPRLHRGALAHVVLPSSAGRSAPPGKFADSAIPEMIRQLEALGANRAGLTAKIAGGACMFGVGGPLQIGAANIDAVIQALAAAGLRVSAQDTGGVKGRRIVFHSHTGQLDVEIAGQPRRLL